MNLSLEFSASRLTIARQRRGLNKSELAKLLDGSPRTITEWEAGRETPLDTALSRISKVLNFPRTFFFAEELEFPSQDATSFRSLTSMTASQRDAALAAGAFAIELSKWIDQRFALNEHDLPDLRLTDPETAAFSLRNAWKIGVQPIRSMVHVLEKHGVRVFSLAEQCREVDAFSLWHGNTPFCFLNTTKSVERSRFDAAHELGHLVLHKHGGPRGGSARAQEHEADAFASAFLMPRSTVLEAIPKSATVTQIVSQKQRWGTSAMATAYRAHKVGLLTDWQYRTHCQTMTSLGYHKKEPHPIGSRETSQVLSKVFASLKEQDGISRTDVARELHLYPPDLDAIVFGLVMTSVIGGNQATDDRPPPNLKLVSR
jgi:Zn-dependent peptidase ImmA (M78 family)/DNA-binding XRE family transcriptional regulator